MDKTMQKMEKGRLAFLNGEFAEAADHYTDVLQTQVLSETIRIRAISGQLDSLLDLGAYDRAWELLQQYMEETDRPDRRERKACLLHAYARYLGLRSEPKAAVKILREELSYISSQHERYFMRLTENYLEQARLFLHMCELSEARIYLDLATYYMKTDGDDLLKACYYYVEAQYLLASKEKEAALHSLVTARELFLLSGARRWAEKTDESLAQADE
ncbi:MAG: hypothetical protein GXY99_04805 [Clostridiaceae bacterium]|nr:hypothetical protein [Clostridiaceae bacterium]